MKIPAGTDFPDSRLGSARNQQGLVRDSFDATLRSMEGEAAGANDGRATEFRLQAVSWAALVISEPVTKPDTLGHSLTQLEPSDMGRDTGTLVEIDRHRIEESAGASAFESLNPVKPDVARPGSHGSGGLVSTAPSAMQTARNESQRAETPESTRREFAADRKVMPGQTDPTSPERASAIVTICPSEDGVHLVARFDSSDANEVEHIVQDVKRELSSSGIRLIDVTINGRAIPVGDH